MIDHPFRPSRLGLRALCHGSYELELGLESADSEEAAEGRLLHNCIGRDAGPTLTDEQSSLIENCHRFEAAKTSELFKGPFEFQVEMPLEIKVGDDLIPGTADFVAYNHEIALLIDWKFGRNAPDEKYLHYQTLAYALGILQRFRVKAVHCYVYSPRTATEYHGLWERQQEQNMHNTYRDLIEIAKGLRGGGLTLSPGSWCKWCRAISKCPAALRWVKNEDGSSIVPGAKAGLPASPDGLARAARWIKDRRPIIEDLWDAIKAEVERNPEVYAKLGIEVSERAGSRYVADIKRAFEAQGLLTPPQIIELCSLPIGKLLERWLTEYLKTTKATKAEAEATFFSRLGDAVKRGKPQRVLKVSNVD